MQVIKSLISMRACAGLSGLLLPAYGIEALLRVVHHTFLAFKGWDTLSGEVTLSKWF